MPNSIITKLNFFAFCFICVSLCHAQTDNRAWANVAKPTASRVAESIGKVTAGCIRGADTLAKTGIGYQVMRLSRKRYFGHPDLVQFVEKLGRSAQSQGFGTLLIGDLGMPRGGPTLSGHKSHQTGLDVDIWYLLSKKAQKRELTASERESWSSPSVITADGNGINLAEWSKDNEQVLEMAANMSEVDRIFVNARVKEALCQHNRGQNWLQKIRPWYAHADHFHVRLKCPTGSLSCDQQEPIASGDGCGADLAWWFTYEAKHPKPTPPTPIVLPKECGAVMAEK